MSTSPHNFRGLFRDGPIARGRQAAGLALCRRHGKTGPFGPLLCDKNDERIVYLHSRGRIVVRTKGILRKPGLSRLRGFGAAGVGGDSKIHLVLSVPFKVAFGQDDHAPWLQALDEFSNSLGIICYLGMNISVQPISKKSKIERVHIRQGVDDHDLLHWQLPACAPSPSARRSAVTHG